MNPSLPSPGSRVLSAGFTLVELLVSLALLTFLMLVLGSVTESASRAWRDGQNRTETFQSARTSLEIVARELSPAVVDTRMQFVLAPSTILSAAGAKNVAPQSPALLWMAPLGENGSLRCVGYYLYRDEAKQFYRLKRIFIAPASRYFPIMVNKSNPRDATLRTSPVHAEWFTRTWNGDAFDEENPDNVEAVVSAASDGVVAFWVQCLDSLGRPIPGLNRSTVHPASSLHFNSAAYFQAATSTPFEAGVSFRYLAASPQAMKANRVPAAVDLTVVTIDSRLLIRGVIVPEQVNVYDEAGALDLEASTRQFDAALRKNGIHSARTFSTRTKLVNGS
jgi:prepilin-type N-terminal cleavage/methylation domain-containing protein